MLPDGWPRESAGYRNLPELPPRETLSCRFLWRRLTNNSCRCRQAQGLAHFSGLQVGHVLIRMAQKDYQSDSIAIELAQPLYVFDSTTIDLYLSLFPWADFRKTKATVKMHTLIDLRGPIPTWIAITTGKVHDVRILDHLPVEKDAFYAMDRGYVDFARLYGIHQQGAFFVVRAKDNLTGC